MRIVTASLTATMLLGGATSSARSQTAGVAPGQEAVALGQVAPRALPAPPAGFRPLLASDGDLARYGLPPRPARGGRNPAAYAGWSRAMAAARAFVVPQVRITARRHGPAIGVARLVSTQSGAMTSLNWGGQALANGATGYGPASFGEIEAEWLVSAVQQPVGTCGGTDVSSIWVGIDGLNGASGDVMQAGTEADASCSNGVTAQNDYPWFEWYPGYEYEITNFPVSPGTSIYVVVQATGATTANATYVNLQTGLYTVAPFSAPAGTVLKGNSAEWIVERPTVNKTLGTLADFGMAAMTTEVAFLQPYESTFNFNVPGTPGAGQSGDTVTMVDGNGNALANSSPQGPAAQFMFVQGAAK
jgi:hypothetical protein